MIDSRSEQKNSRPQWRKAAGRAISGCIFLALGVLFQSIAGFFFACSGIGMDSLSVFYSGVAHVLNIRLGSATLLVGLAALTGIFFLDKKKIGAGTLAVVLGIGPLLNLLLERFAYSPSGWAGQLASSLLGVAANGLGMAFYLHPNLGCGPLDGIMLHFSERTPIPRWSFKIGFDMACVVVGGVLGGVFGLGTLIAAFLTGPVMCSAMKVLAGQTGKQRGVL